MLRSGAPRRAEGARTLVATSAVVTVVLLACGGGDGSPAPDADSVVGSLDSLQALAEQLTRFQQTQSLSSFDDATRADFTVAVTDCAGAPGG